MSMASAGMAGKIYPRSAKGRWRNVKTALVWTITIALLALPLIRWPRAGSSDQAVLFDFAQARAYVFWLEFLPQDLFLLVLVLIAAALTLFLTNTLVGRIWCGFACPQTVWTDIFMYVERKLEGEPGERAKRLAKGGLGLAPLLKHAIWLAIASATGLAIIGYFTDAPTLWQGMFTGTAGPVATVFVLIFTALTYLLAGFARQKVCTHMCPWPRFQAAMLDAQSLSVAYRVDRGEPRGKGVRRDVAAEAPKGDCVDCGLCVAVCPMGIDIREGLQLDCIGCGLCADACDGVMEKVERPRGLIGFYSEAELSPQPVPKPKLRFRPFGYGAILLLVAALLCVMLVGRETFSLAISPERNTQFVRLSDGSIRNLYTMRITERGAQEGDLIVVVDGLDHAHVLVSRDGVSGDNGNRIAASGAGHNGSYRLAVDVAPDQLAAGRSTIVVKLTDADGNLLAATESYFWAPEGVRP
ncbi:cytochrome c oxidase accessory protein CcoG [Devosia sp. 63-57]|uniref:cytochrome c oxidase accessory protein CcoG n=1 Tax=Devosia sp. 63-57 TaxID=1895751 RepID=UPI000869F661|nr:cytochrome c oxidase accessory protein CcoG [Devosia sp. 63-57]ODU84569.1 MAG: cytochrome c oxidase accessory protein CcoG [Pelagibacterium sp. SCN 63-17]